MKTITVAYITARHDPRPEWFLDSLWRQLDGCYCKVLIVDPYRNEAKNSSVRIVHPKPTVWQGPHRLTKADWWAASNSRNTAICLCETEWIAFVDDRSVLVPRWLEAVKAAMEGPYVVCGPYEKVHNLVIGAGILAGSKPEVDYTWDGKKTDGKDSRVAYVEEHYLHHKTLSNPYDAPGEWTYGCSLALPLEWALQVNGFSEDMDGASGEDYIFGLMLQNNGFPIKFDLRMKMIEDRTPGQLGPVMIRRDKGVSPNDRSHWLLEKHRHLRRAPHQWDLRQVRAMVLAGHGFPVPSWPNRDPYDGQPLAEMTPC